MDISVLINDIKFNFRVCILIIHKDEMYIECVKEANAYTLPGGRVKTLEFSKDAIVREMEEELGISFDKEDLELNNVVENKFVLSNKINHEFCLVYALKNVTKYLDQLTNNKKNLDDKYNYYEWYKIDELDKVNLLPEAYKKLVVNGEVTNLIIDNVKGD